MKYNLITILGPTASGKTSFATTLAAQLNTEIISADSRQVYKGMDIGTGKDLSDYVVNGQAIPYHLIDICDAGEKYNVYEYQHDFHKAYQQILDQHQTPVLCGGTGMYIEAVLKGFRLLSVPENQALRQKLSDKNLPELKEILSGYISLHNTTDLDSAKRAIRAIEIAEYTEHQHADYQEFSPLNSLIIGIDIDRDERRKKITDRLCSRLNEGMIDEIKSLLDKGISADDLIYYGLEYKYITQYLLGELSYQQMFQQLEIAIHQFAKRQMTWFRGMERRGFTIHWLDASLSTEEKIQNVMQWLT